MIRHAKRNTGIFSALFALIEGAVLLFVNGLLLVNNILGKLSEDAPNLSENLFTFTTDPYSKEYIKEQPKFTIFYVILVLVGLLLIFMAFRYFKKPIDKEGKITYRKKLLFFQSVVSLVVAFIAFIGMSKIKDFNFVDIDKMNLFCYVEICLGILSIAFAIITFFIKTNIYNLKTVVKPVEKRKMDVGTLYANEKLQKIQQLNELGSISSKDYNDATAKYTQSV